MILIIINIIIIIIVCVSVCIPGVLKQAPHPGVLGRTLSTLPISF